MLKPTASFKISKATKRGLAVIPDAHQRGAWKRAMIQAELSSLIRPRDKKHRNQPDLEEA